MVNVFVGPTQEVPPYVNVGVTTIVPRIGSVVVLVAVKEIFPVPVAPKPISVFVFVHS